MYPLHRQHFASPRSPGFENPLPAAGSHPRSKAVDTRAMATLGLISSFGHRYVKPLFLVIFSRIKIIPVCLMIGKNRPL
jgi:hypothetical protein